MNPRIADFHTAYCTLDGVVIYPEIEQEKKIKYFTWLERYQSKKAKKTEAVSQIKNNISWTHI